MIRWGILGAGNIAVRFADSLSKEKNAILYAISGRNEEKLKRFQKEHPCRTYTLSFEELLKDPNIDAVYIALPHHLHKEWILKALQAKKVVLCEKPACMNMQDAMEIAQCAKENNVLFLEAMKARFQPAATYIRKQVSNGIVGNVESIEIHYGFVLPKEKFGETYHTNKDCGGCLYDIGIYGISYFEEYFEGMLELVYTDADFYNGVEIHLDTEMKFENGRARLLLGFDFQEEPTAMIKGTKGVMIVHQLHRPNRVEILRHGKPEIQREFPYETDDFSMEIQHFHMLLEEGKKESNIHPLSAMVRECAIMDAIRNGFTNYKEEDLFPLSEQEKYLRYESFHSEDAFQLGYEIAKQGKGYKNGIMISIVRESDHLEWFHYAMDEQTNTSVTQIENLRNAVETTGHSTAYLWVKDKILQKDTSIVSGGFPIYLTNGTLVAVVCVTGLQEGKNHRLIISSLEKILDMKLPEIKKAIG